MCGIAGILAARKRQLGAVFAMNAAQEHRGPDGEGYLFVDGTTVEVGFSAAEVESACHGQVAFGHRRLAILDTSSAGLNPISTANGQLWIIHNGEIYNYLELRQELEGLGHRFATGTDTEVLLGAYQEWGVDCFSRFNGMWSTAIWDNRQRRLVLSRDRFGIKPLHVARTDGGLVFASEIKAILASGLVAARLNRASAAQFLRWANLNTTNDTMFEGIEAFPPGHYAVIDPDRPTAWAPESFYDLAEEVGAATMAPAFSFEEASSGFRELFLSSVDLRMRSDVPVGSCLSGGLDSSSVVCAATRHSGASLDTFTSGFDHKDCDEREWSDLVNEAVGAKPHPVQPSAADFEREFWSLLTHQEEPFGSTSVYAQWCLMREARQNSIPVLLDGQGGDETLCGYRKYYMFYLQTLVRQKKLLTAMKHLTGLIRKGDRQQWDIISAGSRYLPGPLQSRIWGLDSCLTPAFEADWKGAVSGLGLDGNGIEGRQIADLTHFSVPPLLRYEDRNSMAWSVEARVPFLDHRLVEFAVGLPTEFKLIDGTTKSVLRHGLRGLVPDPVLDRDNKLGFTTPMVDWLSGELRPMIARRLARPDFGYSLFDGPKLAAVFNEQVTKGERDPMTKVFQAVMFDAWLERFEVEL
ncbi:MAG: asparagine synthase (glutamine-hydrolyzing) [Actinomycetia bacterium]|nr:asparagine synthase (glutamine-hydrolyzing) [Actinomycetes bacterium]MCP4222991.1 asparagine synthase (glutamine-hydrolyzing) [Actinomycetes bacterium]MCP5031901.1 asparagine synthase (glutamine-hydrolyzing) [Actinomycetes bacterium]